MRKVFFIIVIFSRGLQVFGQDIMTNPIKLFDEFWEYVDHNYIYFQAKNINREAIYQKYSHQISTQTTDDELFALMDAVVLELKDAHSILVKPKKVGTQYDYKKGYQIHFGERIVKSKYVKDSLGASGQLYWALLEQNIGYVYLPKFSAYESFDSVFMTMKAHGVKKLIIDIRGNGGGNSNPVPNLLRVLVNKKTLLGSYIEKTGPGQQDITKPIGIYAFPDPNFSFDIPLVVLINRACYSATTYFAAMIKGLPNVTLMGQETGGGAGGHLGYQLSNGWQIRVSVSDFLDKNGQSAELGVLPDIEIVNTKEDIQNGKDRMLEMAMKF